MSHIACLRWPKWDRVVTKSSSHVSGHIVENGQKGGLCSMVTVHIAVSGTGIRRPTRLGECHCLGL